MRTGKVGARRFALPRMNCPRFDSECISWLCWPAKTVTVIVSLNFEWNMWVQQHTFTSYYLLRSSSASPTVAHTTLSHLCHPRTPHSSFLIRRVRLELWSGT
uniref:Uncharacterized protein n=1 Tax=Trichobilharzia regenti TaxID=157069 RepID=A0AA85JCJ9_TRIRE|nr:unnamed protein product [Trichobilharzia regenti]